MKTKKAKYANYFLTGGDAASAASSGLALTNTVLNNAIPKDSSSVEEKINAVKGYRVGANSNDALMNEWNNFRGVGWVSRSDAGGKSGLEAAGSMATGAAAGAVIGSILPGLGTAVGAIGGAALSGLGSLVGHFGAASKQRRLQRQAREADRIAYGNFLNASDRIDSQEDQEMLANYAAYGGNLGTNVPDENSHGGIFSNGVQMIGNGGTHEDNPLTGVPISLDKEGKPNMVEEGEVIFKDYVFSNRLKPTKEMIKDFKLSKGSFADNLKRMQKESSERPNDPISKRGLEDSALKLKFLQEGMKGNLQGQKSNSFKNGGYIPDQINYFDLGGPDDTDDLYSYDNTVSASSPEEVSYDYDGSSEDYLATINKDAITKKATTSADKPFDVNSLLKAAPLFGSGIQSLTDLFGKSNKVDYTNANKVENSYIPISVPKLSNYMNYKPFDTTFYSNILGNQTAATRRYISNNAGGNRGAALAAQLSADYNAGQNLGKMFREAEEYNLGQKQRVEEFNRGTNTTNAELSFREQSQNQSARMQAQMAAAQMREGIAQASKGAKSANYSNFLGNIGSFGKEQQDKKSIQSLIESGVLHDPAKNSKDSSWLSSLLELLRK